jgi:hypothetical protein
MEVARDLRMMNDQKNIQFTEFEMRSVVIAIAKHFIGIYMYIYVHKYGLMCMYIYMYLCASIEVHLYIYIYICIFMRNSL